jgi:hypothetical protein
MHTIYNTDWFIFWHFMNGLTIIEDCFKPPQICISIKKVLIILYYILIKKKIYKTKISVKYNLIKKNDFKIIVNVLFCWIVFVLLRLFVYVNNVSIIYMYMYMYRYKFEFYIITYYYLT